MADRNSSFDALFLRLKESPAGDRIASVLGAEEGLVDVFVFGGARSSLKASASPFVYAKVFVYSDPVRRYRKLSDMSIIESFSGLRKSYSKLWSAGLIAELILKTSGCGGEYARILDLALQALRALNAESEQKADIILLAFLWQTLALMGLQPDLERCALCGQRLGAAAPEPVNASAPPLRNRSAVFYSPAHDGFLCNACASEGMSLGEEALDCLRRFSRASLAECAALEAGDAALSSLKAVVYYAAQKAAEGTLFSLAAQ